MPPLFVYDGESAVYAAWASFMQKKSLIAFDVAPYQAYDYPPLGISKKNFQKRAYLIFSTSHFISGADAIFTIYSFCGKKNLLWWYEHVPFFHMLAKSTYYFFITRRGTSLK